MDCFCPRHLPMPEPVAFVSCGQSHVLAVTRTNGALFTWGSGFHGNLGHGDEAHRTTPTRVEALGGKQVLRAAGGESHSLVIVSDPSGIARVFTFGRGKEGEMGNNSTYASRVPQPIEYFDGMQPYLVSCGNYFSVAAAWTAQSGYVVCAWGDNRHGTVGFRTESEAGAIKDGTTATSPFVLAPRIVPGTATPGPLLALSCSNDAALCLTAEHQLHLWGQALDCPGAEDHRDGAVELKTPATLVDVVCGEMHVVCADSLGGCWSFGYSDFLKLGQTSNEWQYQQPNQRHTVRDDATNSGVGGDRRGEHTAATALPTGMQRMAIPSDGPSVVLAAGSNHTMIGVCFSGMPRKINEDETAAETPFRLITEIRSAANVKRAIPGDAEKLVV
uniref:Uncharacterized protein n=1 Tax=Octactis speculum TaxID=3111310 RepID=A0A7S2FBU2_9STRA